ncbi:MAG TPA: glycosyltransferase N-terminal domain-containing protein [Bacteroidales bacterium]|nr:glycosyltransferase N-terminal domain-containing protein [Bacteroidales bacterium]
MHKLPSVLPDSYIFATRKRQKRMHLLYNFSLWLFKAGIIFTALFNSKAFAWRAGRKGQFAQMKAARKDLRPVAWFHCSSLGEFEQGRPVLEAFRNEYPQFSILLTFFSPSGYNIRKNYNGADYVFYMPLDTPSNVRQFLDIWNPSLAIFIKYEFWFNYLKNLRQRNIPVFVVSAIFREGQHFFRGYGLWFRKWLSMITCFFVQNQASRELLLSAGIKNVIVSGDTRFDRVTNITAQAEQLFQFSAFALNQQVLVAGSTWPPDEELLLPLINDETLSLKFIIVPHEISAGHIQSLRKRISVKTQVFSEQTGEFDASARVLIIDKVGLLSKLYKFGRIAYIGGGFGRGIHNILEAAAFGLPVFFGPQYGQFAEARDLLRLGGAFSVMNASDLRQRVNWLINNPDKLHETSIISSGYVNAKTGATEAIMKELRTFIR